MLSPCRAVSRFAGRVATRDQRGWAGDTGRPGLRHRGKQGTPLGWRAYRSAGSERQP